MRNISRYIFSIILAFTSIQAVQGANVTVKAKLDSVQIMMGRMTMLRMEVVQNAGAKGEFEIFKNNPPSGYVGVCGDSIEIRTSVRRDTTDLGSGRIQIDYTVPVQAFDSGFYRLPQLKYILGKDTAYSNPVTLKVLPVAGVTADSQISGFADVMAPADPSVFDFLPDWLYRYWWIVLLGVAIVGAVIYLLIRFRTKGTILPKKPQPSPYVVAMKKLETLKNRKLWEQGLEREYFTELTEILRQYLDSRFGINAMEMTTRQIIDQLSGNQQLKDKKEYVRQVLDMADFVKFAAVRPLPTDNVASYENALRFIEETKPTPEEEAAEKAKEETGFELPESKDEVHKLTKPSLKNKKRKKKGGKA